MAQRLIVIGGDAAGMSAASAARRQLPQDQLEIVAFERGHYTSYSACGIPYFIGKDVADTTELIARTPQQFRDHHAIDARTGHEVLEIDLHRRAVLVRDLTAGREAWEGFDQLMVATGATPARPPLPGIDAAGIHGVQTLDDGLALRAVLERDRPGRAVVVGAGYIGLELAEALSAWGVDITVIGRPPAPLPGLDPDMGALIATAMEGYGMEVRMEETVTGFETHTGKVTAVVTDQATIPTDLVILGLGVTPNTALAARAGLPAVPLHLDSHAPGAEGPPELQPGDIVAPVIRIRRRPEGRQHVGGHRLGHFLPLGVGEDPIVVGLDGLHHLRQRPWRWRRRG